ncbi:MAG: sporulation protein YqfD [Roseburia sp.]
MILSIMKYTNGYLQVFLTGYAPERFLNLCSNHDILIWNLTPEENGYRFFMTIRGFRQLKPILKKTKTVIKIEKRVGLPFILFRYRKRKIFPVGMLVFLGLLYWMSGYIWKIEVTGNSYLSEEVVLEFLEEQNCGFGTRKNTIHCEELEAKLRNEYGEVIWTSAQIYGTKLTISIQENLLPEDSYEPAEEEISDIVAAKSGTIVKIITRNGTPLVKVGDVVEKGTTLISGRVEVLNDAGEIAEYLYKTADADVLAQVSYDYEDTIPIQYEEKIYTGQFKNSYSIRIGNRRISQPFFQVPYKQKNVLTDTYQLHFTDNFYLPVFLEKNCYQEYVVEEKEHSKSEAKQIAIDHLKIYLANLREKGVQIISENVMIDKEKNSYRVKGIIETYESIVSYEPTEQIEITGEERQQTDESD